MLPAIELQTGFIKGLHQADTAFVFSRQYLSRQGCFVWLCRTNREAERVAEDLSFFLPADQKDRVIVVPGAETDPYRGLSPHPEILEKRAAALSQILRGFQGFVVTSLSALLTRMPSPSDFLNNCIRLEVGGFIPMNHLLTRLRQLGYVREDPVTELGEYSWRGGIVDVFSPSSALPVRIEFFGDEIESIRTFDPGTQRSTGLVPQIDVVPMREWSVTEREIFAWQEKAPEFWNEVRFADSLGEKLQFTENLELFNGFEYLFPLVVNNNYSLLDYLAQNSPSPSVILPSPDEFLKEWKDLIAGFETDYEDRQVVGDLALPPDRLFFSTAWFEQQLANRPVYRVNSLMDYQADAPGLDFHLERKYHGRVQELLSDVSRWRDRGDRIVFVLSSKGLAERLVDILAEYEISVDFCEGDLGECLQRPLSVMQGKVSEGFSSEALRLHVLTQDNVFEESELRPAARRAPQGEVPSAFLSDFRDLRVGDYVVHVDHGLGVFRGLKRIGVGDNLREFVELVYRDEAKLYVPVDRLDLIQKYTGAGEASPSLDRLGGTSWEKTKSRVKSSMQSLAEDLLKLYARREIAEGHAFPPDDALVKEFDEAFEFEETPDQHAAIQDVKRDMESARPMDRLVCGDVGYGKTEVGMRAAFKAVNDGKQVGVLAPTTVLAFQHYSTFRQRLNAFPVRIEMISRFRSRQEIQQVLRDTALGLVDILIGTHRLLSKDVKFRDLGLLVIDEEQRFGVGQKERLKQLKTKVDVVTLSATPIPRTLNMSLIGLRDLSIIETPPKDRLAIQTVVVKFSRNIIRSAIDLELKRQGQVLFLHNSIETIYSIAGMVQEIVPEARVAVGHGQMRETQLEEVMLNFVNYKYDVLVSTTIIENGLDIPRANTLIVNQADRFGLAQLYQLRGRVGRSNRRAYAYLLIPSEETLTSDARKRLAAIKEFSDLGAGFRIAALDLEIRGAGNLLGGEQHGHISAVGFDLYVKLLEQTIRELKGEPVVEEVQTTVDLGFDIQIPEHYIPDANLRLWLYKRVSSVRDERGIKNLMEEVVDRFGKYPRAVVNLFEYAGLRWQAQQLRILSLDRRHDRVLIKFRDDTPISPERLVQFMRRESRLCLSPEGVLSLKVPPGRSSEIFQILREVMGEIAMLQ
ncbi:MAG: transcription-repair coupling factor [Acidobacteria bacterium]|nr:MAG: transcription-repair coupling factor [Acidobacteriota bacterium]